MNPAVFVPRRLTFELTDADFRYLLRLLDARQAIVYDSTAPYKSTYYDDVMTEFSFYMHQTHPELVGRDVTIDDLKILGMIAYLQNVQPLLREFGIGSFDIFERILYNNYDWEGPFDPMFLTTIDMHGHGFLIYVLENGNLHDLMTIVKRHKTSTDDMAKLANSDTSTDVSDDRETPPTYPLASILEVDGYGEKLAKAMWKCVHDDDYWHPRVIIRDLLKLLYFDVEEWIDLYANRSYVDGFYW